MWPSFQFWSKLLPNDTCFQMLAVLNLLAVANYLILAFWYLQFVSCFNHILLAKTLFPFAPVVCLVIFKVNIRTYYFLQISNKRQEIFNHCRQKERFLLANFVQNEQEAKYFQLLRKKGSWDKMSLTRDYVQINSKTSICHCCLETTEDWCSIMKLTV